MFPIHQVQPKSSCKAQWKGKKTRQTEEEVGRQHQGMDRPGVRQVPEGSGEQGKIEKTGCKIICCAPTTLAVKGLMMMMKSFTSWYALLLLFFLRCSSISQHCSPIQFSLAFFMHLLTLFTSLYFSDPSGSNLFFLSSLLLSHRSRISAVTQSFFFWRCLPRISLAV